MLFTMVFFANGTGFMQNKLSASNSKIESNSKIYTQDQMEIELLKAKNDATFDKLSEIVNSLNEMKTETRCGFTDIKSEIKEIRKDNKMQFQWMMGLLSGLYLPLVGLVIGHLLKTLHWI